MGIRLVQQQDGAGTRIHVGQQKQRLLQASPGRRQIEPGTPFEVGHHDLAALGDVPRRIDRRPEQAPNLLDQRLPASWLLLVNAEAEIAQHLRGSSLADPHVHSALIEPRLRGGQSRHRRQESDPRVCRLRGYRHAVRGLAFGETKWPAVERFLVRVIELEPTPPMFALRDALADEIDADVARGLTVVDSPHIPHVHAPPQQVRVRYRDCHQIPAVDGYARPLFRRASPRPFLVPALEANVPERERLHRGGLPGVVRTDEDHRIAELDLHRAKALEVAGG